MLLAGLAFDPSNLMEFDPSTENNPTINYPEVRLELERAFRRLSATATDSLLVAVLKTMRHGSIARQPCFRLAQELKRRNPKPKNIERDIKIVGMYDDKGLTFGQIAGKLDMERDTVERAYHRMKRKLSVSQ
jgi:hypothetical protein